MQLTRLAKSAAAIAVSLAVMTPVYAVVAEADLNHAVDQIILPVMKEHDIPGMAVAVTVEGKRYFYNYGVASKESGRKVSEKTIFELGSVSKTFNGLLGAYAAAEGRISLADAAAKYLPVLSGGNFDKISMLNLVTYTAGGLPLQVPDSADNLEKAIDYFKGWQPEYQPGEYRRYSNASIGLFGYLTAQSMGGDYQSLVQKTIFAPLGLQNTFFTVPQEKIDAYAYGYSKQGKPIRVNPGVFDAYAYGVKSSAEDMIKFVEANIDATGLPENLRSSVRATRTGYFQVGAMTQGLGWEFYSYPVTLEQLQQGNSAQVAYEANRATKLTPPQPPRDDVLANKTGSTNGFGAYVAFVPDKKVGVVMLANKNYPNPVRIDAAYKILAALE